MSRTGAGAALRALRESRDWSLADLAAATGVSIMGLSYLERGARKPHKGTVQKVENGLGLPPGTYARLLAADDPRAELAQLTVTAGPAQPGRSDSGPVVVSPSPAVGAASSNGTCAKTAACCRKIVEASGADPATLKNCDNFKQLPDANCTAALEGYKRSAAVLKVTCE